MFPYPIRLHLQMPCTIVCINFFFNNNLLNFWRTCIIMCVLGSSSSHISFVDMTMILFMELFSISKRIVYLTLYHNATPSVCLPALLFFFVVGLLLVTDTVISLIFSLTKQLLSSWSLSREELALFYVLFEAMLQIALLHLYWEGFSQMIDL